MYTSADVNSRNAEGLTPLILATRDAQMFHTLANKIVHDVSPLEVMRELISCNGLVFLCIYNCKRLV